MGRGPSQFAGWSNGQRQTCTVYRERAFQDAGTGRENREMKNDEWRMMNSEGGKLNDELEAAEPKPN
jgi:hypothetical protein